MEASNSDDKQRKFFKPTPEEKNETLFPEEKIKSTVQGFILAYIDGRIKINFPTKEEIEWLMKTMEETGDAKFDEKAKKDVVIYTEMLSRQKLNDMIAICCGTQVAPPYEQKKAFNELFAAILAYRSSGRISGEFINYDIAERVERLEQGIERINNLLKQLTELHSAEMGL